MTHPFLKSPLGEDPLIMETEFSASAERVFQAWTTASDIKQWFGADEGGPDQASLDLRVDGKWQFVFLREDGQTDNLSGRYLSIEPNKRLVFSWMHTRILIDGSEEKSPESMVTLTLESRKQGSFLRLVHESISSESAKINVSSGWGVSLMKMKALIE